MTASQWVIFRLAGSEYALQLQAVVEVLRMVAVTPVPEAPAWLAGVINLRGRVIPVMDLRARLGQPPETPGLDTRIMVVETGGRITGLMADTVVEVLAQPGEAPEQSDLVPGTAGPASVVSGILRLEGRLITVLDLDVLTAGSNGQS